MATIVLLLLWSKLLLQILPLCRGSNHWVVTEDGRLQAQADSVYNLRRPYDLVALMRQEERSNVLENIRQELISKKEQIDQNEDRDTGSKSLEDRFYRNDPDCQAGGKPLPEFDLYISTVLPLENKGVRPEEHINFKGPPVAKPSPPFCTSVTDLDYSIHAFEHLEGMKDRNNLTGNPELGLKNAITHRDNVDDYGHLIFESFQKNKTSWVLYNMAAFYWRIKGDSFHVTECLRRALHFSPHKQKDVALISLANVLHRAKYSNEAAIVVHAALDVSNELNVNHFTLGNIYAVLGEYNRSVICFENTLKIQPEFEAAAKRRHAVMCHSKLEKALENQHRNLQKTLKDLKDYQKKHEHWQKQQEKLNSEQAVPDDKLKQRQFYDNFRQTEQARDAQGEYCRMVEEEGRQKLKCSWGRREELYNQEWFNAESNWQAQEDLKSRHIQPEPMPMSDYNYTEPVRAPKYQKRNMETLSDAPHKEPKWPSKEECDQNVQKFPSWNEFPTTFLPAENKGFEVKALLTQALGLKHSQEHPLPWYPPVCTTLVNINEGRRSYDHIQAVKDRRKVPPRLSDTSMRESLLGYIDRDEVTEEEIGQRILSVLKKNIGPAWILYNLAGLYWRIIGNNLQSIECIRRALYHVPDQWRDVPLVNLANVFYKWGRVDDAVTVMRDALEVNRLEPETHFFLGNLLSAKGNLTGAVWHYEEALRQQPSHEKAFGTLRIIRCYQKYHRAAQSEAPKPTPGSQSVVSCPSNKGGVKGEGVEGQSRVVCKSESGKEKCVVEMRTRQKVGHQCEQEMCVSQTCTVTPIKMEACPDVNNAVSSNTGANCGNSCGSSESLVFKDGDTGKFTYFNKVDEACADGKSYYEKSSSPPNLATTAKSPIGDSDFNKHLDEISEFYRQKGLCTGDDCSRLMVQCVSLKTSPLGLPHTYWYSHQHIVYKKNSLALPSQCMNMDRRPHIRLEVVAGVLHQRLVFDNPSDMEIRPEECVLYSDGSKSPGCSREEFKPYNLQKIIENINQMTLKKDNAESQNDDNLWKFSQNLYNTDHPDFVDNDKQEITSDEVIDDDDLWVEPEFHQSDVKSNKPKFNKGKIHRSNVEPDEEVTTISLDELMAKYPALKNVKELQERGKTQEMFAVHKVKDAGEDFSVMESTSSRQENWPSNLPMEEIKKLIEEAQMVDKETATRGMPSWEECKDTYKKINFKEFWSTWVSVTTKGIKIAQHINFYNAVSEPYKQPYCTTEGIDRVPEIDAIEALDSINDDSYKPEHGLREALEKLDKNLPGQSVEVMGARIRETLDRRPTSWVLANVAALYWRVMGKPTQAIKCIKVAFKFGPPKTKDLALLCLANILHSSGNLVEAARVAETALVITPSMVATHFALANLYAALNYYDKAVNKYLSTLQLQDNFEPAKERLHSILCERVLSNPHIFKPDK